jgi:hypothetical protein
VSDDVSDERWNADDPDPVAPEAGHDDIMKRLVDYQRSLREGASPEEAADVFQGRSADPGAPETPTATDELVDLSSTDQPFGVDSSTEGAIETEAEPAVEAEAEPAELSTAPEAIARPEPEPAEPEPVPERAPETERFASRPSFLTIPEPISARSDETRADLEDRLTGLEERLARLRSGLAQLRRSFQDMAIDADERLAEMEEEVGQVRREREGGEG